MCAGKGKGGVEGGGRSPTSGGELVHARKQQAALNWPHTPPCIHPKSQPYTLSADLLSGLPPAGRWMMQPIMSPSSYGSPYSLRSPPCTCRHVLVGGRGGVGGEGGGSTGCTGCFTLLHQTPRPTPMRPCYEACALRGGMSHSLTLLPPTLLYAKPCSSPPTGPCRSA